VTYGNGLFVAVGGYDDQPFSTSIILTSPDGVNWTEQTSPTSNPLYGVTYGDGLFVAVGVLGAILTSPDGVSWTERTSGTGDWPLRRDLRGRPLRGGGEQRRHPHLPGRGDLDGANLGDDLQPPRRDLRERPLRGGGGTGRHPHLPGRDEPGRSGPRGRATTLYGVAYGNGLFVAVGGSYYDSGAILTSPDGVSWTAADPANGQLAQRRGLRERHASWRWGITESSSPPPEPEILHAPTPPHRPWGGVPLPGARRVGAPADLAGTRPLVGGAPPLHRSALLQKRGTRAPGGRGVRKASSP
jgi:hypothetical protein